MFLKFIYRHFKLRHQREGSMANFINQNSKVDQIKPMETVEYIDKDPSDIGNNNSRVFEEIKSNVSSQIFNQDSSIRFDQASTPGVFLNLGRSNHSRTNTSHSMMRVASSNFNDSSLNTFGTPHAHLNQANHPYKNN